MSVAPVKPKFRRVSRFTTLCGIWSRKRNQLANPRSRSTRASDAHAARFFFVVELFMEFEFEKRSRYLYANRKQSSGVGRSLPDSVCVKIGIAGSSAEMRAQEIRTDHGESIRLTFTSQNEREQARQSKPLPDAMKSPPQGRASSACSSGVSNAILLPGIVAGRLSGAYLAGSPNIRHDGALRRSMTLQCTRSLTCSSSEFALLKNKPCSIASGERITRPCGKISSIHQPFAESSILPVGFGWVTAFTRAMSNSRPVNACMRAIIQINA